MRNLASMSSRVPFNENWNIQSVTGSYTFHAHTDIFAWFGPAVLNYIKFLLNKRKFQNWRFLFVFRYFV